MVTSIGLQPHFHIGVKRCHLHVACARTAHSHAPKDTRQPRRATCLPASGVIAVRASIGTWGQSVDVERRLRRIDAFDCPSITYVSGSSSFADHAPPPEGSLGLPSAYIGSRIWLPSQDRPVSPKAIRHARKWCTSKQYSFPEK